MNFQLTVEAASPWRRRGWLALIGAAHVLAVWGWRAPEQLRAAPARSHAELTYILMPTPPRPLATPPREPLQPPQRRRESAAPAALIVVPAPSAPAALPPPQQQPAMTLVDPLALPPKSLPRDEDALQRARRSAGEVDRQLRKEAWNPRDKRIANDRTLLAEKLGSAYSGSEGLREESVQLDDGRVMTRVHAPGGSTYCAVKESNGLTGGRDPFRDGIRTKVTTCPR